MHERIIVGISEEVPGQVPNQTAGGMLWRKLSLDSYQGTARGFFFKDMFTEIPDENSWRNS